MYFITQYIRFDSTKQIFQFLESKSRCIISSWICITDQISVTVYDPSLTHHIKTKAHFTVRFLHKLHLVFGVKRAILYCRFKVILVSVCNFLPSLVF